MDMPRRAFWRTAWTCPGLQQGVPGRGGGVQGCCLAPSGAASALPPSPTAMEPRVTDKFERLLAIEKRYVEQDMHALDNFEVKS